MVTALLLSLLASWYPARRASILTLRESLAASKGSTLKQGAQCITGLILVEQKLRLACLIGSAVTVGKAGADTA